MVFLNYVGSDFESHISMYINCVTRLPRCAALPGGASRDTASTSSQTMCSSLFCFLSFQRLRTKIPRWIAPYTRTSSLQAKPGNNTTNHSPQVKIKHLYNNAIVFKMMRSEHTGLVIIFIFIPSIWLWNGACTGDVNYNDIVRVSKLPVCCAPVLSRWARVDSLPWPFLNNLVTEQADNPPSATMN